MKRWLTIAGTLLAAAVAWGDEAPVDGGPYTNVTADAMWVYTVTNGAATLTSAVVSGEAVVPDTLGGVSVTAIADRAFQDCAELSSVTIPTNVTSIGSALFANCTALKKVFILGDSSGLSSSRSLFANAPSDLITIVDPLYNSWRETCGAGTWRGRPIFYRGLEGVNVRVDVNGVSGGRFWDWPYWRFTNTPLYASKSDYGIAFDAPYTYDRQDDPHMVVFSFDRPGIFEFDYAWKVAGGFASVSLDGYVDYDNISEVTAGKTPDLNLYEQNGSAWFGSPTPLSSSPFVHHQVTFSSEGVHTYALRARGNRSVSRYAGGNVCVANIKWTPIDKINPYENVTVELGPTNVYSGAACTQTVERVLVDGVPIDFEVSDNVATNAGVYVMTITPMTKAFTNSIPIGYLVRPRQIGFMYSDMAEKYFYAESGWPGYDFLVYAKESEPDSGSGCYTWAFDLQDENEQRLECGVDYAVRAPDAFLEDDILKDGDYLFEIKGIGNYTGTTNILVHTSKGYYYGSWTGPSLNDASETSFCGALFADSCAYLHGSVSVTEGIHGSPSYSVLFNGRSYSSASDLGEFLSVSEESTIEVDGEYKWTFDFHHAGCYQVDVSIPSEQFEDSWRRYEMTAWSGSYSFTIQPIAMDQYVSVSFPSDVLEYDGREHVISNSMLSVSIDGKAVAQDDYFHVGFEGSSWTLPEEYWKDLEEVVVTNATVGAAAGTYLVSVVGLGDYCGTQQVAVVVNPRSLTNCVATVEERDFVYDGTALAASVTVFDPILGENGAALTEGVDYTVSFADNILPGVASVRIEGLGNYTDAISTSFQIRPASFELAEVSDSDAGFEGYFGEYDGKGHRISPRVVRPSDYEARYSIREDGPFVAELLLTNACDTVQWCALNAVGYNAVTGCARVVIARRDVSNVTVRAENVVTGVLSAPTLNVSVTDTLVGSALVKGRDYTVSSRTDRVAGLTAVTVRGIGNYCGEQTVSVAYPVREVTLGGVTWHYKESGGAVTLCYDADGGFAGMSGMVRVPDEINGKPVTRIDDYAFYGCRGVTGLTLGANVCAVGALAFSGCVNLRDLIFEGRPLRAEPDVFGDADVAPRIWAGEAWGGGTHFGRETRTFPRVVANPLTGVQSGRIAVKLSYESVEGVTELRYTKDGSDPTAASAVYGQKFSVTVNALTTIKAGVFVQGVRLGAPSVFQYAPTLTEIFDANEILTLSTSAPILYDTGALSWQIDAANAGADGTPSMRSCANVSHGEETWLSASFTGAGVFSFAWRSSCEKDDAAGDEEPIFDHGFCTVDGEVVAWIDGETDWTTVVVNVAADGPHEVRWVYVKDGMDDDDSAYEDCLRVDCVRFTYPVTVSFDGGGAQGTVPAAITSAPGYCFMLPESGDLRLAKHDFAGWSDGETVHAAGAELDAAPTNMTFTAVWREKRLSAPLIDVMPEYDEESTLVDISSAEGAAIHYTLDGTEPTAKSAAYECPFAVVGSATIKAVALDEDWFDSPVATATTRRTWTTLEDCLGAEGFVLATGGDRNWIGDAAEGCVKSVALDDGETSWLTATVEGPGMAQWLFRTPTKDWTLGIELFETDGPHTLRWEGSGLGVKGLKWTPASWATFASDGEVTGELPERICSAAGFAIVLPSADGFARARHAFVGWSDGTDVFLACESYPVSGDVTFTAVWREKRLSAPTIDVAASYDTETTEVRMASVDEGATIHYTLDGTEPTAESAAYEGPFAVAGSCTVKAVAVKDDHFDSAVATAATVRAPWMIGECLGNTNLVFETDGASPWTRELAHSTLGVSMRSGATADRGASELRATVEGAGTLAFAWAASSEYATDPFEAYDGLNLYVDGVRVTDATLGGEVAQASWTQAVEGAGPHVICWRYEKDKSGADGEDCVWIADVTWTPLVPTVAGDDGATVTGDAEIGWTVTPSADVTEVVVTIPDGVDAAKVTVKVSPETKKITPNGAAVRVVRDEADITNFLDIPAADASGVIDLNAATVKEEIAKEPLDTAKGAKVDFSSPSSPSLTTAPTRNGLVYRLKEGATLEAMKAHTTGDTKIGDGTSWTPTLTVTGGVSGFYTIQVTK